MPPIPEGQQAEAYHFGASHDAARPSSKKKLKKHFTNATAIAAAVMMTPVTMPICPFTAVSPI